MKYFKDESSGDVYAYDQEAVDTGFVRDGLRPMTAQEIDAHLAPTPLTIEQQAAAAMAERDSLLQAAGLRMAPLQDAVDLDEATEAEAAALKEWKRYRVALNRLPDQAGYPAEIDWPTPPA